MMCNSDLKLLGKSAVAGRIYDFFYPKGDERTASFCGKKIFTGFCPVLSLFIVSSGRFGHFSVMHLVLVMFLLFVLLCGSLCNCCAVSVSVDLLWTGCAKDGLLC